jgi:hypothetical protein
MLVCDCIFGDFPVNYTVYTPYVYMVLANPTYTIYDVCVCVCMCACVCACACTTCGRMPVSLTDIGCAYGKIMSLSVFDLVYASVVSCTCTGNATGVTFTKVCVCVCVCTSECHTCYMTKVMCMQEWLAVPVLVTQQV